MSPAQFRRELKKAGYRSYWAMRKPLLTKQSMARRLAFAWKHQNFDFSSVCDRQPTPKKTVIDQVVFSDEKIFRVRTGGKIRCWRRRGQEYHPAYYLPTTSKTAGLFGAEISFLMAPFTRCDGLVRDRCGGSSPDQKMPRTDECYGVHWYIGVSPPFHSSEVRLFTGIRKHEE